MVMLVHGGPWDRDDLSFNRARHWLADRGYASLAVNFRGSTGLGKKIANAGDREWGAKMNDDLLDAVGWAVSKGVADPKRVAIMGASYGGYAALAALAFSPPKTFACAVDVVGPTNLAPFVESMPAYWAPVLDNTARRVGDPRTPDGQALLNARSPMFVTDKIREPVLIGHGANDSRVNEKESRQMAALIASRGENKNVTYALYPDEGHGFRRTVNRIAWAATAENFLARCIGGAADPPEPGEIEASTLQIQPKQQQQQHQQ